jgi:hypothetical protein
MLEANWPPEPKEDTGEDDARAKLLENGERERFCIPIDGDADGRRVEGPDGARKNRFPMDCNQVALLPRLRRGCWICSVGKSQPVPVTRTGCSTRDFPYSDMTSAQMTQTSGNETNIIIPYLGHAANKLIYVY